MNNEMLSISEAAKLMSVCENTLRDWDIEGKFKADRTTGNHRRYSLQQIRDYLEKNPLKGTIELTPSTDEKILSILLDNVKNCHNNTAFSEERVFSTSQILWLTEQSWKRSKFKKLISVQPITGPCGLVFTKKQKGSNFVIDSEAVAAKTSKYDFTVFKKADFETLKEVYADAIADGIDSFIFEHLPKTKAENIINGPKLDEADYIIAHRDILNKLSKYENVERFETDIFLDKDTLCPMVVIGNYKNIFDNPVFAPYVLLMESPTSLMLRAGWVD